MSRVLAVVVGLLAIAGVGASVHHYMDEPYNAGFMRFPWITAVHVILGGAYLALAPFQFVGGFARAPSPTTAAPVAPWSGSDWRSGPRPSSSPW